MKVMATMKFGKCMPDETAPSIFWIRGCASCRAGQALIAEKLLPTLGME
jgi:hypothetical protein